MVNFVLDKTGSSKLIYVGHSMGTTALFTMINLHPQMADRIYSAHLLAPGKLIVFLFCFAEGTIQKTNNIVIHNYKNVYSF